MADDGRVDLRQATAEARHALEEAIVATTVAAERALTFAEMLDEALAVLVDIPVLLETAEAPPALPAMSAPMRPTEELSPREQEVLALVTEGRTNKAIAEALYVSPNTVKTHVASLLTKLRADSRVQLAAIATKRGLLHERAAHRGAERETSLPTAEAPEICQGQLPDEGGHVGIDHHAASTHRHQAPYPASASRPDREAMVPAGQRRIRRSSLIAQARSSGRSSGINV
jgi:DNA-binding CsgD family transcriptional regulator